MSGYLLADLHVHTALSPCAAGEMTPRNILEAASKSGISLLGVADHNAAGNVAAFLSLAPRYGITVIPGLEVETVEEVHLLTLFADPDALAVWEGTVQAALPPQGNVPEIFGDQTLFDCEGRPAGEYPILLAQSCSITLEEAVAAVLDLGGVAVPSHIYRKANGIQSVLGFIPEDLGIATVEISRGGYRRNLVGPDIAGRYNQIVNSDAHTLSDLYGSPSTALLTDGRQASSVIKMLKHRLKSGEVVII